MKRLWPVPFKRPDSLQCCYYSTRYPRTSFRVEPGTWKCIKQGLIRFRSLCKASRGFVRAAFKHKHTFRVLLLSCLVTRNCRLQSFETHWRTRVLLQQLPPPRLYPSSSSVLLNNSYCSGKLISRLTQFPQSNYSAWEPDLGLAECSGSGLTHRGRKVPRKIMFSLTLSPQHRELSVHDLKVLSIIRHEFKNKSTPSCVVVN